MLLIMRGETEEVLKNGQRIVNRVNYSYYVTR